ncbi:MAG TPA: BrnT family toxin [Chloroflexota bacterium]|nr:BrnT family toxin [Chloroflexota bacterium]
MQFEWDEAKRQENIRKHGLDFIDAPQIFDGPLLVAEDDRENYGETRWRGLGLLGGRVVVVAYTERGEDVIRVISLRRARSHERRQLEEAIQNRLGQS